MYMYKLSRYYCMNEVYNLSQQKKRHCNNAVSQVPVTIIPQFSYNYVQCKLYYNCT